VKKGENKTTVKYGADFVRIIAKTCKPRIKDIGCLKAYKLSELNFFLY